MDLLQRYRLRHLTRAVYDSASGEDPAPSSRVRSLVDYPAALALSALCALLLVVMVVRSAAWGVEQEEAEPLRPADAQLSEAAQSGPLKAVGYRRKASPAQSSQSVPALLTIHVEGAVAQPGIVTVPEGARVHDALKAAGGVEGDAAVYEVNLARKLSDGEYLYVPRIGQDPASIPTPAHSSQQGGGGAQVRSGSSAAAGSGPGAGCININTATLEELQALNGVGPALSQRILEARERSGPFHSRDDVDAISGIGPALLARIEPQLCF
ncbi:helix-hairpin-helix domain-containing protein [Schaalia sp. Marseille-Q2122]|uniref:helix-hairpin-helix domain-containing protein n=1 Tax=Schaalia sp. Marseille-Q2122 TaxID=2736604 RepID=UPI00158C26E5|nr:helix-hairpin-helix domain-containing protein [Schaalia sp. Marseille-Q2122]